MFSTLWCEVETEYFSDCGCKLVNAEYSCSRSNLRAILPLLTVGADGQTNTALALQDVFAAQKYDYS